MTDNNMTENGLIMLYNALVLPYFTYCSTVWHQGNLTHVDKLQKLQNRAARLHELLPARITKSEAQTYCIKQATLGTN